VFNGERGLFDGTAVGRVVPGVGGDDDAGETVLGGERVEVIRGARLETPGACEEERTGGGHGVGHGSSLEGTEYFKCPVDAGASLKDM